MFEALLGKLGYTITAISEDESDADGKLNFKISLANSGLSSRACPTVDTGITTDFVDYAYNQHNSR